MTVLPLERLMRIATCQARPGVVVGSAIQKPLNMQPLLALSGFVDTHLAARMVANGLCVLLRSEVWRRRPVGTTGYVGEAHHLRVMVWMDHRDDQPGMVAIWDMTRAAPSGKTAYGPVLPRPVLVIGRNVRSGAHFVLRYAPGDWVDRLQHMSYAARRFAS
jgi:hypothetical protein